MQMLLIPPNPFIWLMSPFWLFIGLNLFLFFRGEKKNWLSLVYWLVSTGWLMVTGLIPSTVVGAGIMGAMYGISLFVVWWLRPDFYYRWDQGRRPKPKEH
jgi:hypothetical protein